MRHFALIVLVSAVVTLCLVAQTPVDASEPIRVGRGVTPPRLIRSVEPKYLPEARADGIQGTVVFQIVIDEQGRATDISVISPLGFGLDEQAQASLAKWEFAPAIKGGVPVKVLAAAQVNFRLIGREFDENTERRRTAFNVARQTLQNTKSTPAEIDRAVRSIEDLSHQKFPMAMYVVGLWKLNGLHGHHNPAEGLELVQKAAGKEYGPALYEVAIQRIEGRDLPQDTEKGLKEMSLAAARGSQKAQSFLGSRYETGNGVPRDLDRAQRYYRLCAAQGEASCQYRLGRLLYEAPERRERDYLQAVTLFQLAAEQGFAEAKSLATSETAKLTDEQISWVISLKRKMIRP